MNTQLPENVNTRYARMCGILVLMVVLLWLGILSGTSQAAMPDRNTEASNPVAPRGGEPEMAILEYVVTNHPDWTCGPIGGTPGHRTLGCYTGAGHNGNGTVDNYGDEASAWANWQQRRDHAQLYYPTFQNTSWSGYPGYHGEGKVPPYNFFTQEDYYVADVRVLGGTRVDDTHFHYAPDIATAIMNAAAALGYLPKPSPTPTSNPITPSPTSTHIDPTSSSTSTAVLTTIATTTTSASPTPTTAISTLTVTPSATIATTAIATVTVTSTVTATPTPECGLAWREVPNPLGGTLSAVDAISADDVWAVGSNGAMHFDGTNWTVVPVPVTGLVSVSAASANDVWATDGSSVIHWDGTSWGLDRNPVDPPTVAGYSGIDAISANDVWIVGSQWTSYSPSTLAMHWDGVLWTVSISPTSGTRGNGLTAVSGISQSDMWAVGSYPGFRGIIARWDGNQWNYDTNLFGGFYYFEAIDAIAIDNAWAVGYQSTSETISVLAHYDGASWSEVPGTNLGGLRGVDGASSNDVWAVGDNGIMHWDGNTWAQAISSDSVWRDVKAIAADDAWAVGDHGLLHYSPALFSDVPPGSPFYDWIQCLACRGIISGYADGTFRPGNDITRGQIAKIVSNAAGFEDDVTGRQTYADVPESDTFWLWVERLSAHAVMGGYGCGGLGEPCDADNRPYFRTTSNATRGQLAKIVSNAAGLSGAPTDQFYSDVPTGHPFYLWIMRLTVLGVMSGYDCGGPGEPCDGDNRPYFRPFNNVTRGQASKIVANTFFPDCQTPAR